jgi:hypothetical protein
MTGGGINVLTLRKNSCIFAKNKGMKADIGFFQELQPNGKIGNSFTRLQCAVLASVGVILVVPCLWDNTNGIATGLGLIGIATGQKLVQKFTETSNSPTENKTQETNIQ